jgi:glucokinase
MPKKYAIGIDIGGTNIKAALVSSKGEVVKSLKESSAGDILESAQKIVEELFNDEVAGVGIGIAGLIDKHKGIVTFSPNIHSIEGIDFTNTFKKKFHVPVFIENDANAAALGEKWMGAGQRFNNFVLLTLGTGIGGGIIYKGELADFAAEVGHMSINADGAKCPCGNLGCLELYVAANAIKTRVITALEQGTESLLREYCQGAFYKITTEDIYKFALDGDSISREALRETGRYLGVGITNIIDILSPEAIILGGGLIGAWNIYVQEAMKEASRRTLAGLFEKVEIIPAKLGNDAGAVGSAKLVFSAEDNKKKK